MTDEIAAVLGQYRAGLEAEIRLLTRLETAAARQHAASQLSDFLQLESAADERDRLMAGLVSIEQELRTARQTLAAVRDQLAGQPEFEETVHLHRAAVAMVKRILGTDQDSMAALAIAEAARRAAARALEQGEVTLEAYRRMAATPPPATLVNRRG
jgi:hypothetical protein